VDCFSYKNLGAEEEYFILAKFYTGMEKYNMFYKCFFEKKENGVFRVSIYVNNKWNPLYASVEDRSLKLLCKHTKEILIQQLDVLRSTVTTNENSGLDGFI